MIKNGQEANETNLNAAFVSRTNDTSTTGKVSLQNTADVNSGGTIANAQRALNETFDAVGIIGEGDATRKTYSSANYIASGDSHKVALGKLDAQAKAQSTAPTSVTNASGTLPIGNGGTGQTSKASAYDALSPNTTEGDLEVRGPANTGRLGVGTTGQVLPADTSVPGKVKWAALPAQTPPNVSTATGTLPIANGGTNATTQAAAFQNLSPLPTKADLLVNNARLPVGSDAQVLTADSTTTPGVKWASLPAQSPPNVSNATGTLAIANGGTGSNTQNFVDLTNAQTVGGAKTLSSNPVFSAMTTAGVVVNAASGQTSSVAQLPIVQGGTGQNTSARAFNALSPATTAGDLIFSDGTNNARLPVGTTGQYLTISGGLPSWATVNPGGVATYWIASYYYNANTSVAANTPIKWDTKREDTNNSFATATGILTVPFTGRMRVIVSVQSSAQVNLYVRRTSGTAASLGLLVNATANVASGHTVLSVTAGDTFVIQADGTSTYSGTSTTYGPLSQVIFERAAY